MDKKNETMQRAVGRRKEASARVRLAPGKGMMTVNGKEFTAYFPTSFCQQIVLAPLAVLGKEKDYDISVKVEGGGVRGQAEAARHGLARALLAWNPDWRPLLRSHGFLTRDPRVKERKKFGRYKARRGHQWRKR